MSIKIRNTILGEGIPKICVPIVGNTLDEIIKSANKIKESTFDIIEWRADFFEEVFDLNCVKNVINALRDILEDAPILFTFRTKAEGGNCEISSDEYASLLSFVSANASVDLIDIEVFFEAIDAKSIINIAHASHKTVIGSNHNFSSTPTKADIISRLNAMLDLGVDIPKIAVMPNSSADVITLLDATEEFASSHKDTPIITMSMSGTGLVSRLCGEVFGSAMTFGAVGQTSAPGQIDAKDLSTVLNIIHSNMNS